jgi:hypothetical protein
LRALNHNERTHSLQRQIRRDGAGSRRGRRSEELIAQSGALALVTNLVMAWNTHQMQATLDLWRAQGREIDPQILRHITPMGFEGINFLGESWFSPWTCTGRDCCRRARLRPPRWSPKQAWRPELHHTADRLVFENGTFDIHCTPRPTSATGSVIEPRVTVTFRVGPQGRMERSAPTRTAIRAGTEPRCGARPRRDSDTCAILAVESGIK